MKIFKNVLSIFVLSLLLTNIAYSQSANVTASATVINDVTVENNNDLEFGNILATDTPTIAATNANSGSVVITGAVAGITMGVTVTFPTELTGSSGGPLSFATYSSVFRTDGTDDQTSGTTSLGTPVGQEITGDITTTTNSMYVYVGGQIDDASLGEAGVEYTGTITVEVDYP